MERDSPYVQDAAYLLGTSTMTVSPAIVAGAVDKLVDAATHQV